jgi:hypothetical protein
MPDIEYPSEKYTFEPEIQSDNAWKATEQSSFLALPGTI